MPRSAEPTRQRILDVAEQLFAEHGVTGVSLREINRQAGQRNSTALQYHFVDRRGLLQAIADRHQPAITARQIELSDEIGCRRHADQTRAFVDISVRPFAEYLGGGPSARAWVVFASELAGDARTDVELLRGAASSVTVAAAQPVYERLAAEGGEALAIHRLRTTTEAALHVIADRARHEAAPDRTRALLPLDDFIEDLLSMTAAAIDAPIAARTD